MINPFTNKYIVPGADPENQFDANSQGSNSQENNDNNEENKESKLGSNEIDKKMKRVIIKGIELSLIHISPKPQNPKTPI